MDADDPNEEQSAATNTTASTVAVASSARSQEHEDDDGVSYTTSEGSVANLSTVSSVPDRHGFLGGFQYSGDEDFRVPVKQLRRRELKWMHMIKAWDKFVARRYEKVRERCRKGIPSSVRGRAWYYLCNGHTMRKKHPHLYDHLVQQPGDAKIVDEIARDIHRQFPSHEMFAEAGGAGQGELFNVLKAYATFNTRDGYCQAHAPLAATLLMQMPSEEAFFCLASLCNNYLPLYFAPDLQMLQVDANLLMSLLKKTEPAVYKHLKRQGITPILFMTDWFMCVYTRNLPWETVLRVWDMFFCEGRKVLFRVGLTILRLVLGPGSVRRDCPSMHETVTMLRNIPSHLVEADFFMAEMAKLKLSEDELSVGFQRHWAQYEAQKVENLRSDASRASFRSVSGSGSGTGRRDRDTSSSSGSSFRNAGATRDEVGGVASAGASFSRPNNNYYGDGKQTTMTGSWTPKKSAPKSSR